MTTEQLRELEASGVALTEDGRERIRIADELKAAAEDAKDADRRAKLDNAVKAARRYEKSQGAVLDLLAPTVDAFARARKDAATYREAMARARSVGVEDLPVVYAIGLLATRVTDEGRQLRSTLNRFAEVVNITRI